MRIFEWLLANRELAAVLVGILINLLGLIYNIYRLVRAGQTKKLKSILLCLENARQFEIEAEGCEGFDGAEKMNYVLARLRALFAQVGVPFDEEQMRAQVEQDIAFSKQVNAEKSDLLE